MGEIKENQQVKLFCKMVDGSEKELTFKIKSFNGDRIALNPLTSLDGYMDYLQEGEEIKTQIFTPLGVQVFNAMILNSPSEPEFVIEYIENSVKIQRREYLRMPLKIKIVIERNNREVIVTQTVDLSGGGARFLHNGDFDQNEVFKLSLYIPDERLIQAKGIILPNEKLPTGQQALMFEEIDERDRDRIIKKCFEMQFKVE